jgi:Protein of unknown function (DUF3050)
MSRYDWGRPHPEIERLERAVEHARDRVITHPLYANLDTHEAIVTFMEHHVFAVWDFMSLLKSLQRQLTCVAVPWVPTGPNGSRRLINDIVLVEESGELGDGFTSHFELYVAGMRQAGADTSAVDRLVDLLRAGTGVREALAKSDVPRPAVEFAGTTWTIIETAPVHCQAAAFAFGREAIVPAMFSQIAAVNQRGGRLERFVDYLERHLEDRAPMAMRLLADLCGDDGSKWQACIDTVNTALAARARLWDGILEAIKAG